MIERLKRWVMDKLWDFQLAYTMKEMERLNVVRLRFEKDDKRPDDAIFKPKAMKAKPDKSKQRKPAKKALPKLPRGFTRHNGGKCPVAGRQRVEVAFRDGIIDAHLTAGDWAWTHHGTGCDIIGYKVIKTAAQKRKEKDTW